MNDTPAHFFHTTGDKPPKGPHLATAYQNTTGWIDLAQIAGCDEERATIYFDDGGSIELTLESFYQTSAAWRQYLRTTAERLGAQLRRDSAAPHYLTPQQENQS